MTTSIMTLAELDEQNIELLPARNTMALINVTMALSVCSGPGVTA